MFHFQEDTLLVGGEGPNIETHSISQKKILYTFKAHERRVKAAAITKLNVSEALHLVTVSNDGFIKLWHIKVMTDPLIKNNDLCNMRSFVFQDIKDEPVLVTQIDSTCRITCLSLWTEKSSNMSLQPDVKPLSLEARNRSSKLSIETSSPNKKVPALKSLLKRTNSNKRAAIVKTSSGPFIAEPITIRNDKKPRLTFDVATV